jgi:cyanate permease
MKPSQPFGADSSKCGKKEKKKNKIWQPKRKWHIFVYLSYSSSEFISLIHSQKSLKNSNSI